MIVWRTFSAIWRCDISRAQETQTFNTASGQNKTNEATAQSAEQSEQGDIGQYQSALSKFAAQNPYVQGGEAATSSNQIASNTADANANATAAQLQDQAKRTGQNPAAANATAATTAQSNERELQSQEASANQSRIGDEASYNQGILSATGQIPGMENNLASTAGGQANGELQTEEGAGETPSWLDTFGGTVAKGLGNLAVSGAGAIAGI